MFNYNGKQYKENGYFKSQYNEDYTPRTLVYASDMYHGSSVCMDCIFLWDTHRSASVISIFINLVTTNDGFPASRRRIKL